MLETKISGTYLGLDLGGTKLMIGEVDGNGTVLNYKRYPSGYLNQANALHVIKRSLDDYLSGKEGNAPKPLAMGLGIIGRVDHGTGTWFQIDTQRNAPTAITEELEKLYGIPCYADNDVRSATKAEMVFGHGKDSQNFIYINIGTGIAAGIVERGKILTGSHFNAGEVGHTLVGVHAGTVCGCGRSNCVETIAAGVGFDQCARIFAPQFPDTSLHIPEEGERVNVREVFDKVEEDPLCALLTNNAAEAIANLIMNLVRVSDPEMVVLGGGVVSEGFLFPRIQERLNANTMRFVTKGVVLTKLQPALAGLLGACTVAMNVV